MENIQTFRKHWKEILVSLLILANFLVWLALYNRVPGETLSVYFLDVGQGDSILIDSPSHGRVLIDGGRTKQVISQIGRILPFGDKNIDVVIATHPDADHIGGLPEVVSRYKVNLLLEAGVESDNEIDNELRKRVGEKNIQRVFARRGQVINFGDGAKLIILFPNQDVSSWETNEASIVAKLVYGESSFLFTGDAPIKSENILLSLNYEILESDVLKAGHHGSRTSTSLTFAEAVHPEYAIISAGKDNTYGHPHKEVLNILEKVGAKIFSTAIAGTIKFTTNGATLETN